ncbi:coiled-coil domain-containing protein 177-like [Penaeus vannamei]|uniref:coiled-coil domain-containing protein 177-like n=1 Tax=Penaeus vannamei TaxID=6689 RepID=UPI00387F3F0E
MYKGLHLPPKRPTPAVPPSAPFPTFHEGGTTASFTGFIHDQEANYKDHSKPTRNGNKRSLINQRATLRNTTPSSSAAETPRSSIRGPPAGAPPTPPAGDVRTSNSPERSCALMNHGEVGDPGAPSSQEERLWTPSAPTRNGLEGRRADARLEEARDWRTQRRQQETAGGRRRQEETEGDRSIQEAPVGDRRRQEETEGDKRIQEAPVGARRIQEAPAGARRIQEAPVGARSIQEAPVGVRRLQEAPVGDRRHQELERRPKTSRGAKRRHEETGEGRRRRAEGRRHNKQCPAALARLFVTWSQADVTLLTLHIPSACRSS